MNARQVLVSVCLVVFLASEVAGQTRVGLFGGANLGELHPGEAGLSYTTHAFPAVGAAIDVGVGRNVFLRVEPMFLGKGSDFAVEADGFLFAEGFSGSLHLDYVELPLLVVVSKSGAGVRPYALAGPTFGYLLSAEARARGERHGVTDSFKRGDLGLSLGGGLQFPAGPASVLVEARYTQGLWDPAKGTVQDPRPRNRGLLVGAGLTFPIAVHEAKAEAAPAVAPTREGFWMGFGLGYGFAHVSCRDAVTQACDRTESAGGPSGLLTIGWTLTPKLLLGAEGSFWSGHTSRGASAATDDFFLTEGPTLGSVSVAGYFYPLRSRGLFLKGGAGLSLHASGREGIPTSWGWGWTAGVGYDVRVARDISLTPFASVQFALIGDAPLFKPEDIPPELAELNTAKGLDHNVIDVGLRVTVH